MILTERLSEVSEYRMMNQASTDGGTVVDMLPHEAVPVRFLSDPALQISLRRTWRQGLLPWPSDREPVLSRILRYYDRCTTPRYGISSVSSQYDLTRL